MWYFFSNVYKYIKMLFEKSSCRINPFRLLRVLIILLNDLSIKKKSSLLINLFFFFFGLFLLMNFRFFNSRKNSSVTFREIQQKLVLLYFFDIQISVLWHLTMMKSFYLLTIQLKVCKSQSNRLQTFMLLFCLLVCFCFLSFDCLADKNGKVDIFKIYLWWYRKQYKSNYSVGIIHQVKNILVLWWLCWKEWWEGEGQSHPFLK